MANLETKAVSAAFLKKYHAGAMQQAAENAAEKDEALSAKINEISAAIETINGSGAGSMTAAANAAIASALAGADEDFDTLKEMSDWLSGHADSAAQMNSAIAQNTSELSTVKSDVEQLKQSGVVWADDSDLAEILAIVTEG